ncbi:hypothetical protein [Sinorhizobium sp. CCBAU 05631]|uniref:hypothetical protein n=1 Tax=Sinorhizobium sp. CCBAU 05631 TaxID=794846 RepID=UPI00055AB21E|nr:hypothetical protein [Sinorhizobium sp. CCBAU 05631]ASY57958.1 hypothetical protein SS05631_c30350 [Sinorhizobium sp. CCBAU 05631]
MTVYLLLDMSAKTFGHVLYLSKIKRRIFFGTLGYGWEQYGLVASSSLRSEHASAQASALAQNLRFIVPDRKGSKGSNMAFGIAK